MSRFIDVGYVARPHGVRGEVRVVPYDRGSTTLMEVAEARVGDRIYEILAARPTSGAILVKLAGIADRDRAGTLRGCAVSVARELIAIADGEILLVDLVGCTTLLPDGTQYGKVVAIQPGPQDLLVIHGGEPERPVERLLPFVAAFVVSVDLEAGEIVVDPPEGLPENRL